MLSTSLGTLGTKKGTKGTIHDSAVLCFFVITALVLLPITDFSLDYKKCYLPCDGWVVGVAWGPCVGLPVAGAAVVGVPVGSTIDVP